MADEFEDLISFRQTLFTDTPDFGESTLKKREYFLKELEVLKRLYEELQKKSAENAELRKENEALRARIGL